MSKTHAKVTPSSGCVFCDLELDLILFKGQVVHGVHEGWQIGELELCPRWQLVPKEPTEKMLRVGAELVREFEPEFDSAEEYAAEIYKGMGEAAPKPE